MNPQTNKLTINQWAEDDRPREKLHRLGPTALSNAELLAILIGSGTTDESAVALMQRVLNDCNNNLNTLGKLTIQQLTTYKGIGPAKAITILAACEIGKRRQATQPQERPELNSATRIYNHMHPIMQDLDVEEVWALLMNQRHRLIDAIPLSRGGISGTAVDIRLVVKEALLKNATVVAICHNHPSGNPFPSASDDKLTQDVKKACNYMNLHLADHVIVTDGAYYSYLEEGRL